MKPDHFHRVPKPHTCRYCQYVHMQEREGGMLFGCEFKCLIHGGFTITTDALEIEFYTCDNFSETKPLDVAP
jgi:hypothetical protein